MSRAHLAVTSSPTPPARPVRCATVWVGVTALAAAGVHLCTEAVRDIGASGPHASADSAVLLVAALVGALACAWVWLVTTTTVVDHLRGRSLRSTGLVRRLVLGACGVAVTLTVTPAHAESGAEAGTGGASTVHVLDGLPLPDRATNAPERARPTHRPPTTSSTVSTNVESTNNESTRDEPAPETPEPVPGRERTHVVLAGESLWAIAAEQTGAPSSADAETVRQRTQALYARNRAVIGTDPDLIRPGQELVLPAPDPDTTPADDTDLTDDTRSGGRR